jgi:Eukaryotic-type carbonic anhydrase
VKDRDLREYRIHNPRYPKEPSQPKFVSQTYYNREWHPYDWYVQANTEVSDNLRYDQLALLTHPMKQFYFRYEGSTVEPPCIETTHWRVLSNPIKVSPSQLRALHYLLKERIDPNTCEPDTAAFRQSPEADQVKVNRPIQTPSEFHQLVYCECSDWKPKGEKDQAFCELPRRDRGVLIYAGEPVAP